MQNLLASDFIEAVRVEKVLAKEGFFASLSKSYIGDWLASEDQRELMSAAARIDIVHRICQDLQQPFIDSALEAPAQLVEEDQIQQKGNSAPYTFC